MNILMLRGQIPQDRNPQEIVFDNIKDCDDMWTQLVFAMTKPEDNTQLWYWGGNREHKFANNFTEIWLPEFHSFGPTSPNIKDPEFEPDVIFCRGGFRQYHEVLKRFPRAIKIYYGAGARHMPQPGFNDYDIILQDSPEQVKECKAMYPDKDVTLFIKPAADNLFYPIQTEKQYDVCFPANAAQAFKGHKFVYSTIPEDISLLNLGNNPRGFKYPSNVTSYRVLRSKVAENIAKCRVGIMASEGQIDSCPRVIPEMLACDIPVVALKRVKFWRDKYIVSGVTGELVENVEDFWPTVRKVLKNLDKYTPRDYYIGNLSLDVAANFIRRRI